MRAPRQAVEIDFDHATKRYPGRAAPAVDDLSLSIPAGEICCLVGPSGGGKTTAMKLVNRLVELTSGDVRDRRRAASSSLDETELRRGIGYVIQQVGLFPHMTVAENVATVPRLLGWSKARNGRARRRAARPGRPARARLPRPVRLAALRRRAPARRARACPRRRPARDADGRAVRRPRPDHAHPPAEGAAAHPGGGPQDDHLRHPRHRRGDPHRRPDRDPARGRRARAVRHARGAARPPRRRVRRALRRRRPRPEAALADAARRAGARTGERRGRPRCSLPTRRCATRSR